MPSYDAASIYQRALHGGTNADELQQEVDAFFNKELAHRMRPGCKQIMEQHLAAGERCIICTSSWQGAMRCCLVLAWDGCDFIMIRLLFLSVL